MRMLIVFLNIALICILYSCSKDEPTKDNPDDSPPPSIAFSFVISDEDSNYLWRFPDYKKSPYDPRKIYWVSESGIKTNPFFQKYQFYATNMRFVTTEQIEDIDTGQLVAATFWTKITDDFLQKGENYYIHFPNGDVDTLYYNYRLLYSNQDSSYLYNGKVINWYSGGGKLPEYNGMFVIIKQ